MFVLSNFLTALAGVVNFILTLFYWLILIRALISWVNPDPYNAIVQFLYKMTEPVLEPIRRMLPFIARSGFDISPIIAFLFIMFLQNFLVSTILGIAARV